MPRGGKRVNKLSIHLIKEGCINPGDYLKTASAPISIEGVGNFYYSDSHPNLPSWLDGFFAGQLDQDIQLISSSAQGVLIVPLDIDGSQRLFALTFGQGRHLLKSDVTEGRFGLRVVLNSADPESLRSIDKTTLGSVPKHSKEQMSRAVSASEFGIDVEQDLVSSVTAKSLDKALGVMPAGRDSLSVSVPVDIKDVKDFLKHCYARFVSNDYKKNFAWIDHICEIRDQSKLKDLDEKLVEKINSKDFSKIWMAVPSLVDWIDVEGFSYGRPGRDELYTDIGLESFIESLEHRPVTSELLHGEMIYMVHASDGSTERWPAFRCIYAEISEEDQNFLLTGSKWYEINKDFVTEVNKQFATFTSAGIDLPSYDHESEAAYNLDAAKQIGAALLDKSNIHHGGGQSQIEVCDILTPNNEMIFVKKYAASSVLSHLFAQGVTGAEVFVADPVFREKLNNTLPDELKMKNPKDPVMPSKYKIVYAIVSYSAKDLDIPFFSKVSLKNARRTLAGFGFMSVHLQKIQSKIPIKVKRTKSN